jgi:hypothetical protein
MRLRMPRLGAWWMAFRARWNWQRCPLPGRACLHAREGVRTTKDGPAGGAQTGVIVGNDVFHPTHAARLQAFQKGAPVDLCL